MEPGQALELAWGRQFKKDKRKLERQGKNLDKLWEIVALLQSRQPLLERCRDHALRGTYATYRDCHIEPDWVLIYRVDEEEGILRLYRMGSHAELELG